MSAALSAKAKGLKPLPSQKSQKIVKNDDVELLTLLDKCTQIVTNDRNQLRKLVKDRDEEIQALLQKHKKKPDMALLQQELRKLLNKLKNRTQLPQPSAPTNVLKESNQQSQKARSPQPKALMETPAPQAQIVQKPPEVVKSRAQAASETKPANKPLGVPTVDKKTLTFGRGDGNSLQIGGNNDDLMELLRQKHEETMNRNFVPKLNNYTEQQAIIEKSEEEDDANRSSSANSPHKDIPERFLSAHKGSEEKKGRLEKMPSSSEHRYLQKQIKEQEGEDEEGEDEDEEEGVEEYEECKMQGEEEENEFEANGGNKGMEFNSSGKGSGFENYQQHFEATLSKHRDEDNYSTHRRNLSPFDNENFNGSPLQDSDYKMNFVDNENIEAYYKKMNDYRESYEHCQPEGSGLNSEQKDARNQELSPNYGEHYASSHRNDSQISDGNEDNYNYGDKQSEYEGYRRDGGMSNCSPEINSNKKGANALVRQSEEGSYYKTAFDERKLSCSGSNYNEVNNNESSFNNESRGQSPTSQREIMNSKANLLRGSEEKRNNKFKLLPPSPNRLMGSIGKGNFLSEAYRKKTPSRGNSPGSTGKKGSPVSKLLLTNEHSAQKKLAQIKEMSPKSFEKTSKAIVPDEESPQERNHQSAVPLTQQSPSRISEPMPATRQPVIVTADLSGAPAPQGKPPRSQYSKPFVIETSGGEANSNINVGHAITPVASRGSLLESVNPQNTAKGPAVYGRSSMFSSPVNIRGIADNSLLGINSAGVNGTFSYGVSEYLTKKLSATDERIRPLSSEHRASFNERLGAAATNFVYRYEDHGLKSKVNSTVTAKPSLDAFEVREFQRSLDLQRRVPEHVFEAILGDTALTRISKVFFCLKMEDFAIGNVDEQVYSKFYDFCDVKKDGFLDSNELGCSLEVLCEGKSVELNSVRMLFNRIDHEKKRYIEQSRLREILDSLELPEEELERTKRAISDFFLEADKDKKGFLTYWDVFLQ